MRFLLLVFLLTGCVARPSMVASSREQFYHKEQMLPFVPEYEDSLERVVLMATNENRSELSTIANLERALPRSTSVVVAYRQGSLRDKLARSFLFPSRISYLNIQSTSFTSWAQDYAKGAGNSVLLPLTYAGEKRYPPEAPGNRVIEKLAKLLNLNVVRSPLEFAGGNVLLARNSAALRYVLVGADSFIESAARFARAGEVLDESAYREIMRLSFNADEVLILGRRNNDGAFLPQNRMLFHLDQLFLPLEDGVLATLDSGSWPGAADLSRYRSNRAGNSRRRDGGGRAARMRAQLGPKQQAELLSELITMQRQLVTHGFQMAHLPMHPARVARTQSILNGVLFYDSFRRSRHYLFPLFQSDAASARSSDALARERLESLGIKVTMVSEEGFYERGGNLHCIMLRGLSKSAVATSALEAWTEERRFRG